MTETKVITQKRMEPDLFVHHGVQRFPNPIPHRNPGGDCFACATYAVVRHLYPDKNIDFGDVWNCFTDPQQNRLSAVYNTMEKSFFRLKRIGAPVEVYTKITMPNGPTAEWERPFYWQVPTQEWWYDAHAYLSAGWVGITHVKQAGGGPVVMDGDRICYQQTDHIVVIDGARRYRIEDYKEDGQWWGGSTFKEVHVVDSAKSNRGGWHEIGPWLMSHGASGVHWLRRKEDD